MNNLVSLASDRILLLDFTLRPDIFISRNPCVAACRRFYETYGFIQFCELCTLPTCVVNRSASQMILIVIDALKQVRFFPFFSSLKRDFLILLTLVFIKLNAHDFVGLTPGQIFGSKLVEDFLSRFCRLATKEEIIEAGFDPLAMNDGTRYRYLLHSPSRRVTIPGFTQYHNIHMTWNVGMIIDPFMIQ